MCKWTFILNSRNEVTSHLNERKFRGDAAEESKGGDTKDPWKGRFGVVGLSAWKQQDALVKAANLRPIPNPSIIFLNFIQRTCIIPWE